MGKDGGGNRARDGNLVPVQRQRVQEVGGGERRPGYVISGEADLVQVVDPDSGERSGVGIYIAEDIGTRGQTQGESAWGRRVNRRFRESLRIPSISS